MTHTFLLAVHVGMCVMSFVVHYHVCTERTDYFCDTNNYLQNRILREKDL